MEQTIPPTTAIPIATRLSAPAPVAIAIGKIPNIVDKLVIRIGRKRATAESSIASLMDKPAALR